jgi:hypothetical protein
MPLKVTDLRIVIFAPTSRTNALGRAICLAEVAAMVSDSVTLLAPDDGPLWARATGETETSNCRPRTPRRGLSSGQ